MERRFVIRDVTEIAGMYGEDETITEAQFLDRIDHVRGAEFITSQQAIDIMLHGCHGEGEQPTIVGDGITDDTAAIQAKYHNKLPDDEWEEWAVELASMIKHSDNYTDREIRLHILKMPRGK